MKESDSTAANETDEEHDKVLLDDSNCSIKQEASQDCGNNCLTGIKWPPEHQAKNEPRKRNLLNGFRKVKTGIVTHGGRTSKLPARYQETDSESETIFIRKRIRSRREHEGTSGERSSTCKSTSKRKICKNGRIEPLKNKAGKVISRRSSTKSCYEGDMESFVNENGVSTLDASETTKAFSRSSPSRTTTTEVNLNTSRSDSESSSGEIPRKRGRTPKSTQNSNKKARGKRSKLEDVDSPHGECFVSATNTCLTSPNLKPKKKKRKLLNGLRAASFALGVSSDDSSSECSPKKRGRPPKPKQSTTKDGEFREKIATKNGVRKPWVRPLLKSLHKRALYQSHEENLGNLLSTSENQLTKTKHNMVARKCTNGDVIKRKPGRPSQLDLLRRKQVESNDIFSLTDEEDRLDRRNGKFNGHLKKIKKLKKSSKLDKRPLGSRKINKVKKHALKIKKKALKRTTNCSIGSANDVVEQNDTVIMDDVDSCQSKRHQKSKVDKVLGMRQLTSGSYEYLVQWKDGTSCWASTEHAAEYDNDLKEFLGHQCQDLSGINRLVFKAYYTDNLAQINGNVVNSDNETADTSADNESMSDDDDLISDADDIFDKSDSTTHSSPVALPKKRGRKPQECNLDREYVCKEVSVQKLKDCTHITISRSSGKQMRVNLRIIDSLTLALEEAAVDTCDTVVLSGLGNDMFCGMDLDTIVTVPLEGEVKNYRKDVDKIRYLIQTIQYYPKPIIATINKPAQGVGAQLIALCDMVCDKAALGDPVNLATAKANGTIPYCFPRLMGHGTVSEHVLMGQPLTIPVMDWQNTLSDIFKSTKFTSELLSSVEAMRCIPTTGLECDNGDRIGDCTSDLEQKLHQEVEKEKIQFEESMKKLVEFWEDVTSSMT